MTDIAQPAPRGIAALPPAVLSAKIRRRYRAEARFRAYGLIAIFFGVTFLAILFGSILSNALSAFRTTEMTLTVQIDEQVVDRAGSRNLTMMQMANWNLLVERALAERISLADEPIRLITLIELERASDEEKAAAIDTLIADGAISIPGVETVADGVPLAALMDVDGFLTQSPLMGLSEIGSAAARTTINGAVGGVLVERLDGRVLSLRDLERRQVFDRAEVTEIVDLVTGQLANPGILPDRFPQILQGELNDALFEAMRPVLKGQTVTPDQVADGPLAEALDDYLMDLVGDLISPSARLGVRDAVFADLDLVGGTVTVPMKVATNVDQLLKGEGGRDLAEERRLLNDLQVMWIDRLLDEGVVERTFNWEIFYRGDSRNPEVAGLGVAVIGSAYMMLIVLLLTLPLGVATAVYLEEFAPKNRATDLIEVNINNLAAVPSIVFGLLGLAVFINFLHLPQSAPVVGGLVLTLMTLPTVIIATRAALRAVPPSIREAALGVGASKMQAIRHHVLPLAAPGILTGTIIGMAHALGETAPLIMIGMVAFVADYPATPLDPASALPVQVYRWSTQPERGFVELTSAAILVLLAFLIVMNATAVWLRRRFERRW